VPLFHAQCDSPIVLLDEVPSSQRLITTDVAGVLEWPRFEPAIRWGGFDHPYLLAGYALQDNGPRALFDLLAGPRFTQATWAARIVRRTASPPAR
jgi:hypothetical protein